MGKKSRQKHQRRAVPQQSAKVAPIQNTMLGERLAEQAAAPRIPVKDGFSDYSKIRSDIRRILMILAISVSVLAASVVVNSRSSVLRDAGSSIANFLEL